MARKRVICERIADDAGRQLTTPVEVELYEDIAQIYESRGRLRIVKSVNKTVRGGRGRGRRSESATEENGPIQAADGEGAGE